MGQDAKKPVQVLKQKQAAKGNQDCLTALLKQIHPDCPFANAVPDRDSTLSFAVHPNILPWLVTQWPSGSCDARKGNTDVVEESLLVDQCTFCSRSKDNWFAYSGGRPQPRQFAGAGAKGGMARTQGGLWRASGGGEGVAPQSTSKWEGEGRFVGEFLQWEEQIAETSDLSMKDQIIWKRQTHIRGKS